MQNMIENELIETDLIQLSGSYMFNRKELSDTK